MHIKSVLEWREVQVVCKDFLEEMAHLSYGGRAEAHGRTERKRAGATWAGNERGDFTGKISTAAAAAKSLQSRPTLCDPMDGRPPGCPVPGIL